MGSGCLGYIDVIWDYRGYLGDCRGYMGLYGIKQ